MDSLVQGIIGENINTILNILDYIPSILVAIDFEKAFDYLEWSFIFKVLKCLNFGENIQSWVKMLYTNPVFCVHNNGWQSDFFSLSRGVYQGCPLSLYLFILCAKILSNAVRRDENIKGIKIGDSEIKIIKYADDTTLLMYADANSLNASINLFTNFRMISGLKINTEKTEVMRIGGIAKTNIILDTDTNLKWTDEPTKALGVYFTPSTTDMLTLNYEPVCKKMKSMFDQQLQIDLSLNGKITVTKMLGLSQFTYLLSNIPSSPSTIMKDINNICFKFIWENKQDRIKCNFICLPYDKGSMNMNNIMIQEKSLKVTWVKHVKRYIESDNVTHWKVLLNGHFPPLGTMGNDLSKEDFLKLFATTLHSRFWIECISYWCEYNYNENVNEVTEI